MENEAKMTTKFHRDWIAMDEYKEWLLPDEEDSTKAKCILCQRSFTLSNMGTRALKSHAQGKKHQSMVLHVAKGNATPQGLFEEARRNRSLNIKITAK